MADHKLPISVLAALGILTSPACPPVNGKDDTGTGPCLSYVPYDDTGETTSPCLDTTSCLSPIDSGDSGTGPCLSPVDSGDSGDTATGPCLEPWDSGDSGDTADTSDTGETTETGDTTDTGDTNSGGPDPARSLRGVRASLVDAVVERGVLPSDLVERLRRR